MTRLILLGGFLGAGKTTTLLRLAAHWVANGKRVGILTNDQGHDLVDTELFRLSGFDTRDVRGGCFCCRLDDFVREARSLGSAARPDVLLAEPVGSCTDLVATVLRPLQQLDRKPWDIAPYAVLIDPLRALDVLSTRGTAALSEKITYVYRLQQLEADALVINKVDLTTPAELEEVAALVAARAPNKPIFRVSASTGAGIDALHSWLASQCFTGSDRSPPIDYDAYAYASGEAELAWFDGTFVVTARAPLDLDHALLGLASMLQRRLAEVKLAIAHVKLLVRGNAAAACASLVGGSETPELRVASGGACVSGAELTVNARVAGTPEALLNAVESCMAAWAGSVGATLTRRSASAFSPARPVPTRRIDVGHDAG